MTTAGNGYVISNDTRKSKRESTQHAQTVPNSVYVLYDEVLATHECGLNSQQIDPPLALSMVPDLRPGTMGSFLPSPSAQPGSTFTPSYPTKTVQDYAAPVQRSSEPPSVPAETFGAVALRPTETEIPGSSILPPQELMSQSIDPIILEVSGNSETRKIGILDNQQFPPAVELIPEGQALPRALNENKDSVIESSTIVSEDFNDVSLEPEPSSEKDDPEGSDGPPSDPFPITHVASIARSDNSFAVAPTATLLADSQSTIGAHLPLIPITLASDSILHEGSDGGLILAGATIRPGIQTARDEICSGLNLKFIFTENSSRG
ncbi:hypothetical protein JMJ35_007050 [Cladonia borealis]|uniref:Uncharacterized protein n=1 Tax=Cladonia borealis TaxID=184061 RepID=A0AA39QWR7_9LECA|nr:hypothetical protein JMJ35_007050 [Cladonia borealis]